MSTRTSTFEMYATSTSTEMTHSKSLTLIYVSYAMTPRRRWVNKSRYEGDKLTRAEVAEGSCGDVVAADSAIAASEAAAEESEAETVGGAR